MKRGKSRHRPVSIQGESIGVLIHSCDQLRTKILLCHPVVKVYIFESATGHLLPKSSAPGVSREDTENEYLEPIITKPFDFNQKRSLLPVWEEMLVFEEDVSVIQTTQPSKLIMFEIADTIKISLSSFKQKSTEEEGDWYRVAWAFLKPVGSDGTLNLGRQLRLQLYKIRKQCKVSHHTCDIFHLYADHDLKKHPGSLYVTVKGVQAQMYQLIDINPSNNLKSIQTDKQPEQKNAFLSESKKPEKQVHKWTRMPTQSCKVPISRYKELSAGRYGVSCLKFDGEGTTLACGTINKIFLFNILTGEEIINFQGHNGLIYELDWSDSSSMLLSTSGDCTASVWNVKPLSTSPVQVLPHPSFVYCGRWLKPHNALVTGCKDHVVRYWLKVNNDFELVQEFSGHHGFISALATQNTSFLYSGDSSGYIFMWQYNDNHWSCLKKLSFRESAHNVIDAIHLHPGERRLLVTVRAKGSFMIDIASGVVIQIYKTMVNLCTRSVTCMSPCGSLIFSYSQNNGVSAWEVDTGKLLATYDNIFPVYAGNVEVSGYLHYHPFEHLLALCLLGQNYPVVLLNHEEKKNDSKQLGMRFYNETKTKPNEKRKITRNDQDSYKNRTLTPKHVQEIKENILDKSNSEDYNPTLTNFSEKESLILQTSDAKLASVIKKIDKVFTASKIVKQFSNETGYSQMKESDVS